MKDRIVLFVCLFLICFSFSSCKEADDIENIEVIFINRTGNDIGILKFSPQNKEEWSENLITDTAWRNNYELPIDFTVNNYSKEEWRVTVMFLDKEEVEFSNIILDDKSKISFYYENNKARVEYEEIETGQNENGESLEEDNGNIIN